MIFFSLLTTAFSSIFYGVIVTAVVMAILYFILKTIGQGIVQTLVFYVSGVVLAILLIIQFSLLFGAYQAKDATNSAKIYIEQRLEQYDGTIGAQDSQRILDSINEQFPVIVSYIGIANFSGNDVSDLPEIMHQTMTSFLNSYIWHRVWWILGIVFVACIVVILYDRGYKSGIQSEIYDSSGAGGLQF